MNSNQIFGTRHVRAALFFVALLAAPSVWAVAGLTGTTDDGLAPTARKLRGDTITYTNLINNPSATDATGVVLTDPTPANTTQAGVVLVTPIAVDDGYASIGNTPLTVAAPGVLANDFDPDNAAAGAVVVKNPGNATRTGGTSTGGTLSLNANGGFTYTPGVGQIGTETFSYTITDTNGLDSVTQGFVTFTNTSMVWYVDNSGANGDGRKATPFNTLAGAVTASGANDNIYVAQGTSIYNGGVVLKSGQKLVGSGDALVVNSTTIYAAGTSPTLTNSGTVVQLSTGNTVEGINIGDSTADIKGTSFGTLTVANVTLNGTGAPLLLDTGTLAGSFNSISTTSATGNALGLTNVNGTLNLPGITGLSGVSGTALLVSGGGVNITLATLNLSSITGGGVSLVNDTGTFSVTSGTFATIGGDDVSVSGGTGVITFGANINNTAGHSVLIDNHETGNVTISGTINDTGTGILVQNCNSATIAFSNGTKTLNTGGNTAVSLLNNTGGTINFTGGGLVITTSTGTGFNATGGGTISVQGTGNTINGSNGVGLNVANTTIGASGLTFQSITVGTSGGGPANGIVLTSTGGSGGLTVTGNGNTATGGDSSGGIIQHVTAVGIALTSTLNPSFADMNIHNTSRSGVAGTSVTNFTFKNCTVNQAGTQNADANIAFNSTSFAGAQTQNGNNISGTLTIIGNTLINGFSAGLDIQSDNGAVTSATVTNNTVTGSGTGTAALSFVGTGNGTTVFDLDNATIANNTISGQKAGGIQISIGNSSAGGPVAHAGFVTIDGFGRPVSDPSHIISITGNSVTSIDPAGTQAITVANSGGASGSRTQTNFEIKNNGTVGTPLGSSSQGTVILVGNNGYCDMAGVVSNNVIVSTQTANLGGGNGIAGGNGVGGAGNAWTPRLTLYVVNNTITGTDGNDILLVGRGTSGQAYMKVANNNVHTPVNAGGTARECIRIDAGNAGSADDAVFLTMTGNTSQLGSNGAAGLGIRKQGTTSPTVNDFGITGLTTSPATGAQAAAYVATQNPSGNGCDNISGAMFTVTTLAPP